MLQPSNNYEFALWYSSKAKRYFKEGEKSFQEFRYSESVTSFAMSLDISLKAICLFLKSEFKYKKEISKILKDLSQKYKKYRLQLSRAAIISDRWKKEYEKIQKLAECSNPNLLMTETKFYGKKDSKTLLSNTLEVINLLHQIESEQKNKLPRKIGILNGYVDGSDPSEKPCQWYDITDIRIAEWEKRFSDLTKDGLGKYEVEKIPVSRVGNEFAVIINPYGEAYPERDVRLRSSFNIIKDYVENGGVFVNVAGYPFFWAWDVIKGKQETIFDEKKLLPESVRMGGDRTFSNPFLILLNISGSILLRELGIVTTYDTEIVSGINQVDVYQNEDDKKIAGEITSVGGKNRVHEFRALRKECVNLIPFLRANRTGFGEVYTIFLEECTLLVYPNLEN
jgi:HEPN domain-containing protein